MTQRLRSARRRRPATGSWCSCYINVLLRLGGYSSTDQNAQFHGSTAFVPVEATPSFLSSGPVISEESVEGAGVYAPSFGETRCQPVRYLSPNARMISRRRRKNPVHGEIIQHDSNGIPHGSQRLVTRQFGHQI